MNFKIITIDNKNEWDNTVKSFADYEVYYLSGYAYGFKVHGDGEPVLLYFEDKDRKLRAMNVVMKREIADIGDFKNPKAAAGLYDAATPYGYGGLVAEGNITEEFCKEYSDFCAANNIVSEFVRFNPITDNQKTCSDMYDVVRLGETVYIDLRDEDYVWNNFTGKNRNVIRKAIKEGVTIHHTDEPWIIDEFMEIYNSTMDRDEATDYYYFKKEYYESIVHELKGNYSFFYAMKDDKIIAVSIILFANNRMHYHLSASRREFQRFAPTNLMLFEACKFGIERGFSAFHLGGGVGSKEDGLYKFKKSFNKNENKQYCIGKKIYDIDKYNELIKNRNHIENKNFFPEYRG